MRSHKCGILCNILEYLHFRTIVKAEGNPSSYPWAHINKKLCFYFCKCIYRYLVTSFKIVNSLQGFVLFCVLYFDSKRIQQIRTYLFGAQDSTQLAGAANSSTPSNNGIGRKLSAFLSTRSSKKSETRENIEMRKVQPEEAQELV